MDSPVYDYVIIGSGFGGSVSAMRLVEKGYSVLLLEKGKRYNDQDFATTNLQFWKYLWAPALRSFGILQISILKGLMVLHGAGVGGGSLGYANVLEVPSDSTFATPAWNVPLAWGEILRPYFETASKMLGVTRNPSLKHADLVIKRMAEDYNQGDTFRTAKVGTWFGDPEVIVPDPYFGGQGPDRTGCRFCGGCMVGCRYNAKNSLPKNYLFFAEKNGAHVISDAFVTTIQPISPGLSGARYKVTYHSSTTLFRRSKSVLARNVIVSAGVLGTVSLLLRQRDVIGSLPNLSPRLGDFVRTNNEALLGSVARGTDVDYSQGVAISSIFNLDEDTRVEPVRYPDGSSLMRILAAPLIDLDDAIPVRILKSLKWVLTHPVDFLLAQVLPGWARKVTILLVMQHKDNRMRLRLGRSLFTLFLKGLVAEEELGYKIYSQVNGTHSLTRTFARHTNGIPMGSLGENLLNLPTTAHILGGAPIGRTDADGVVDEDFQVHNYPGLFIIDGSIVPANPGVNPSLTITAFAEYAISKVPQNEIQEAGR